jgi:nucleoid-associated protein YgaU
MSLINKSYKKYNRLSRYSPFPYYYNTEDRKYIYGTTAHLSKDTPYVVHTVVHGDNLDTLSLQYYNNPTYFWIIADFNSIQDPYIKLKEGSSIKIPSFAGVEFDI